MTTMKFLEKFRKDTEGATMIEYAILAGLISVVAITVITSVGTNVNGVFTKVDTELAKAK